MQMVLRNKKFFLNNHNVDIACVSETHLKPEESFKISNYKIYRKDRICDFAAGGVAILIKKNIRHDPIIVPNMISFELVGVQIYTLDDNIFKVYCTYLQPSKQIMASDLNKIFDNEQNPTILAGDLNSKHPAWYSRVSNPNGRKLFDIMNRKQWVVYAPDSPTYFPSQRDRFPDVLDILLCQNINCIVNQYTEMDLDSDHIPVIVELDAHTLYCPKPLKLINGKVDWETFKHKIDNKVHIETNLDDINKIDGAIDTLTQNIKQSILESTATKSYPNNINKSRDLPFHLKQLIQHKNRIRRRWNRNHFIEDKQEYNKLTKEVRKQLDHYWHEQYQLYLEDIHPEDGSLYKETKRILKAHDTIPPLKIGINSFVTQIEDKCELFGDMLEDTFKINEENFNQDHVNSIKHFNTLNISSVELPLLYVTPQEINAEIHFLKNKKTPGHDLISNEILKQLPNKAVLCLTSIFNACLRLSYFPEIWKHAQIILFKKPNKPKDATSSYRPISLLCCVSKLLEKVIASRLKDLINQYEILPTFQFGFREGHSTIHQMMKFSEFTNRKFEEKKYVASAFLDFQQAFDKVWHDGLIFKLKKLGFPQYIVGILKSFLENRTFCVKLDNFYSSIRAVRSSVPQGSVLGPLLFLVYVSDIANNIAIFSDLFLGMFADDKMIAVANHNVYTAQAKLQLIVHQISNWCHLWCISLNENKCEMKIFHLRKVFLQPPCIKINNTNIPWKEESIRWLGIWFDQRLTWADHIKKKVAEGKQRLKMLFPILNKNSRINMKTSIIIYKTIIMPMITYGCPVWMSTSKTHMKKLQTFQNKILRIICKAPWFIRNANIHRDLNVEPIYETILQRTHDILSSNPHGIGTRMLYRRKKPHLPQDLEDIVYFDL